MVRHWQGLVFDGQMIRLEDGTEVALSELIEDARRRGAEIRRLVRSGLAAARRLLAGVDSVEVRRPVPDFGAPDWAVATAAFRSDAALGHFAGASEAVEAVAAERAPDQLAA
jgi:hypothetical protein